MFKKIVGLWFPSSGKNKKDVKKYISGLVEAGAGEFFTGYTPTYWSDKFGFEVSPNGRFAEHEQITDIDTLREVCEAVHSHGLELFGNLNAWYYTDETFPFIERMLAEFEEIGLDGIICGNIWILEHLKEVGYKWKINISTILAVYNSEAIRFMLENYRVNKIILSRELTLREIEKLMKEFSDTKFEVFWEGDFCRYNNGLCYAEHKYGAKDICTIVVNDLVYKNRYHPDFKKIILDDTLSNEQKIEQLWDDYENIFEAIWNILKQVEIWMLAKWDNLNLYSYLFFSQFPNIDTVKFPTRGRNYAGKIALIEKVLTEWKVDEKYIHRWVSIERAHYDLEYLFWDKLWFRKMMNK